MGNINKISANFSYVGEVQSKKAQYIELYYSIRCITKSYLTSQSLSLSLSLLITETDLLIISNQLGFYCPSIFANWE